MTKKDGTHDTDVAFIEALAKILGENDLTELNVKREYGDNDSLNVRVSRKTEVVQHVAAPVAAAAPVKPLDSASPPPAATSTRSDLLEITAPMVGTFYRAPAPGEPSFVEVGTRINVGQAVCILEAMKLMNELESEVGGEVVEILVDNGTPVEFGQVLMRVKPA